MPTSLLATILHRVVYHDPPNDIMSGFGGVAMTNHLCALVEGRFKKEPGYFVLASFTDFAGNPAPHVGDENEILQCLVTAKFVEHPEFPSEVFGE